MSVVTVVLLSDYGHSYPAFYRMGPTDVFGYQFKHAWKVSYSFTYLGKYEQCRKDSLPLREEPG